MSEMTCPLCGREMTAIEPYPGCGELYCVYCDLTIGDKAKTLDELMALLEQRTCRGEIDSDYFECKLTTFKCHSCGWSGVVDSGYAEYSFDGTDMPRHCPNCGKRIREEPNDGKDNDRDSDCRGTRGGGHSDSHHELGDIRLN